MDELENLLQGLSKEDIPVGDAPAQTRNTKGLMGIPQVPGEFQEDGSYIDAYGIKHYASGAKYKFSPADRRLIQNGRYSGKEIQMQFTKEELDQNPFLGLDQRDYQTLMLYAQGLSRRQIATELEICEQTVTTRLSKPKVKKCMLKLREMNEEELHSLVADASQVLREAVQSDMPMATRLSASRDILKATGHMDRKLVDSDKEDATSQMEKVLEMLNLQVNVNIEAPR